MTLKFLEIFRIAALAPLFFLSNLESHPFPYEPPREMYLVPGMSDFVHPVTTTVPEAQSFFNQGLTYKYAFNHDAAYWSFQKAAKLDPEMAMAYWGMALVLGSDINSPITPDRQKTAYEHIQKAIKLSDRLTDNEKGYIQALALRYSNEPNPDLAKLETAYKHGMKKLANTFPEDPDAATLYAESILNLDPWHQWSQDGSPLGDTLQAVEILESVLKRMPNHLGANHYYIHVVEASKHPERALTSANRLQKLLPASGHILHMPSHIYLLLGDYHLAAEMNEKALAADEEYVRQFGMSGSYPVHYMSHNYYFLARSYALEGQLTPALKAAQNLQAFYVPYFQDMPDMEEYAMAPQWALMRFNCWSDIIKLKPFPDNMKLSNVMLNFAKAYAFVSTKNPEEAEKYTNLFLTGKSELSADAVFGYNRALLIAEIAEKQLKAKTAYMQENLLESIELLKKAVILQDKLNYNEPPDWYYSIRESLGAVLLANRMFTQAETVFREDLELHPRNGRSLFGLLASLKAQQKDSDAFWVQKEFDEAWQYSNSPLALESLF